MKRKQWMLLMATGLAGLVMLAGCAGPMDLIKGEFLLQRGQYQEAVTIFQEMVTANPDNVAARNRLGFALLKAERFDDASVEFEKVLDLKPGDSMATLYLGIAYASTDQLGKAVAIWQDFSCPNQPIVQDAVQRQLTLLQIAYGQRLAKIALADEAKLGAQTPEVNTVAVCYFEDLTVDKSLTAFQKGLAAMVTADLGKVKSLKVIERIRLQALLVEIQLGQTGIVDAKTAPKIGRLLGADKLLVGSLAKGSINAAMTVSSAGQGSVLGSAQLLVPIQQFYTLPAAMIQQVATIAGISMSPEELAAIGIPHTQNIKAFTYFGQALDALDAGNWQEAQNLFAMALEEDPDFELARRGADTTPKFDSPGIGDLRTMPVRELAILVMNEVELAQKMQTEANASADMDTKGGGGGGY